MARHSLLDDRVSADDPSANYMGPKAAPFRCDHCRFFVADKQPCEKVFDPIEAQGCCNLYKPKG